MHLLLRKQGGAKGVQFVFVSACESEESGNAFVQAGVPHVVAIRSGSQLADTSAIRFMKHFYTALLVDLHEDTSRLHFVDRNPYC